MKRESGKLLALVGLLAVALLWNVGTGPGPWALVFWSFRLPRALVAVLAGSALGCSGLQLQTLFQNPLADPFVLGISAGSGLAVALVMVGWPTATGWGLVGAAWGGAVAVGGMVVWAAIRWRQTYRLLVLGLVLGYVASAAIGVLLHFASLENIRRFGVWGAGDFGGVTWRDLPVLAIAVGVGQGLAIALAQPLNLLLLGDEGARALGLNLGVIRGAVVLCSSLLAGATTAFCGPIAFLGVAVPHLAAGFLRTGDRRWLVPAVGLLGAILALVADTLARLGPTVLPLNATTALLGAPVVLWLLLG